MLNEWKFMNFISPESLISEEFWLSTQLQLMSDFTVARCEPALARKHKTYITTQPVLQITMWLNLVQWSMRIVIGVWFIGGAKNWSIYIVSVNCWTHLLVDTLQLSQYLTEGWSSCRIKWPAAEKHTQCLLKLERWARRNLFRRS